MEKKYDAIVIGAGSGGLTVAIGLSKFKKKVLLIEKDKIGGECANTGCIPSKHLIYLARLAKTKSEKEGVLKKVEQKIEQIRNEKSAENLSKLGIKVIKGEACFIGPKQLLVNKKTYTAPKIIIATGSRPKTVKIQGLKPEKLLTNQSLFQLRKIPENLVILGGGAIGCEMTQAFRNLGSKVTIVTQSARLINYTEPEISEVLEETFLAEGIKIHTKSTLKKASERKLKVEDSEGGTRLIEYDYVLQAIGRHSSFKELNLSEAGIEIEKGRIKINHQFQTTQKGVYAIGDVASAQKFTHVASEQGRYLVKKIIQPLSFPSKKWIPKCLYLNQEVASVGLTHAEAIRKYDRESILKIKVPISRLDRSKTDEDPKGIAIMITKKLTGRILGFSIMSKNAGEIISIGSLALKQRISAWSLNSVIYPYPTFSEIYKFLSDEFIFHTYHHGKDEFKNLIKRKVPLIIAAIIWIAIFVTFFTLTRASRLGPDEILKGIYYFITGTAWGPLIYIFIYALRPLVFFPSAGLTLLSGILFGFSGGLIYTLIGENISGFTAYLLGRIFGKKTIDHDEQTYMGRWRKHLEENSFFTVLIMRLMWLPFDPVNFLCGWLHVRVWPYLAASFFGTLPGTLIWVGLGDSIENIESFKFSELTVNPSKIAISLGILVATLTTARILHKNKNKIFRKLNTAKNKA